MATFIVVGSSVPLNTAAVVATDTYRGGVLVNSTATQNKAATAGGDEFSNGLFRDDTGPVIYVDATAGLPANTQWTNGLPLSSGGALCVSTNAAATYSNGIPFAANGAVAVTITP
jgi:hypothetical protein